MVNKLNILPKQNNLIKVISYIIIALQIFLLNLAPLKYLIVNIDYDFFIACLYYTANIKIID